MWAPHWSWLCRQMVHWTHPVLEGYPGVSVPVVLLRILCRTGHRRTDRFGRAGVPVVVHRALAVCRSDP